MGILDYIERIKRENEGPRITAQEPRIELAGGQLVQPNIDGSRPGYSGSKYVTYEGIKYPLITKEGHPHEGKIRYRSRTKGTEYLEDKDELIKRRKLYKKRTDVGRFTAQELKEFKAKITTPEVGHINLIKHRGGIYRISAGTWGEEVKTYTATEDNIIKAQDHVTKSYKKKYPNALLDSEFLKLRLSDENINLTSEEFAKKLKKYTTKQGKPWKAQNVFQANTRLNISEQVNPKQIREYSLKQVKEIIRESSGGQAFINANINNVDVLKKEASRLLANRRSAKSFFLGFPVSDNNPSKMWRNLYISSTKGDRIKVRGDFNGKDLANPANWPRKENGSIDWRVKGKDGVPFYQKIKFQDTEAPNKAIFTWEKGKAIEGGNLKNQIDSVFGDGFFAKSTKAYSEQALDRRTMIKTKDGLKSVSEILGEKLIIAKAKADGVVPTKDYIADIKKTFSLKDVHHNRGIGNDPYSTESTLRSANRTLSKYETDYAAGRITNKEFIKKIKEIGKEHGGIRFQVDDVMVGKKATQESIVQKIAERTGLNKKTHNQILKSYQANGIGKNCKAYGGRVGFQDAGAVGVSQCMNNAIQEHNKNLQSENPVVRNRARSTQFNINKSKNMKSILDLGGKGINRALRFGKAWGAEWEPVFEGAFYEWARRKGYTHDQAKEETFFWKMLDPSTKTGLMEGADPLLEKELYEIRGEEEFIEPDGRPPIQHPEFGKVIGERGTVKKYIDNEKALMAARNKYSQLVNGYNAATTGRERNPEKAEAYAKAAEETWKKINSLEDKLDLDRDTYQAAVEKQQHTQGTRALEYGEYGSGDTEKLAKQREKRRQREMEDKFPLMSKAELNKKLEAAGLYVDPKLRYKGKTVQRPEGLDFLKGWTPEKARDYFRDLDKSAYFADNFRMEKADGGLTRTVARDSGPMSQGLRSLYIDDMDY